ncbi:MAG: serine/threonine protein kinase [Myxococcales bacterium]|nr:serine/threonine protein kinase [Myxococcales bacterium]
MYRLFVFEGDPQTTQALQVQLEKLMINTSATPSLYQAQLDLDQTAPHLILFDLTHPLHEVETLYRWVSQHPKLHAIPRIFLSLPHQEQLLAQLRSEGEQHIFERPLRPSQFIATLQALLSQNTSDPFLPMGKKKKADDALSSMVGRKIGSFVLEEEIGRGGMGAVFRAYQEALQRKVALKLMLPNAQQDETCIKRFQREALAIAQLKSPYIVQVFDAGTTEDGVFYIAMEFLEGENIDQFLRARKRLTESEAISIIEQVAQGLKAAHDAGQIHRDIKPSNLIINLRGHVTLTDFGLVRGTQDMSYTQPGIVVGSPHYLSPEQASGKPLDHRSDVYALGIVFYELLTGTTPFRGPNISNVMLKHIQEPLPDPRQHAPEVTQATVQVINKMTQKEPAQRYQDCSALLEALRHLKHPAHSFSAASWTAAPAVHVSPSMGSLSPPQTPHAVGFSGHNPQTSAPAGFASLAPASPSVGGGMGTSLAPPTTPLKGSLSLAPHLLQHTAPPTQARLRFSPHRQLIHQEGMWSDISLQSIQLLLGSEQALALPPFGPWKSIQLEGAMQQLLCMPSAHGYDVLLQDAPHDHHSMNMMRQSMAPPAKQQTLDAFFGQLFSTFGLAGALLVGKHTNFLQGQTADPSLLPILQQRISPINQACLALPIDLVGLEWGFQHIHVLFWRFPSFGLFVLAQPGAYKSTLASILQQYRPLLQGSEPSLTGTSFSTDSGAGAMSPLAQASNFLSEQEMEAIQLEFTRIIGPMAQIAMKQTLKKMGHPRKEFPRAEGEELLQALSRRLDAAKQDAFLKAALPLISSKRSA